MKLSGDFEFKLLMGGALLLGVAFVLYQAKGAAQKTLHAFDPTNNDNLINTGVQSLYQGVTGSDGTIGTDFWDLTHPPATQDTGYSNPIYGAATTVAQKVTGNSTDSLGTMIYGWFH